MEVPVQVQTQRIIHSPGYPCGARPNHPLTPWDPQESKLLYTLQLSESEMYVLPHTIGAPTTWRLFDLAVVRSI